MIPRRISSKNTTSPTSTQSNTPASTPSSQNKTSRGSEAVRNILKNRLRAFGILDKSTKNAVATSASSALPSHLTKALDNSQTLEETLSSAQSVAAFATSPSAQKNFTSARQASISPRKAAEVGHQGKMMPTQMRTPDEVKFNSLQLRNKLLKLPTEIAQPYRELLSKIVNGSDSKKRDQLLNQMAAQVDNHIEKFTTVEFKGVTTEIPRPLHQKFIQLRLNLLKLPPARAEQYSTLLKDVLGSKDTGKRDLLLNQLSSQVDSEVKGFK